MTSEPLTAMIDRLTTEAVNPASADIDTLSPLQIVQLMNAEDARTLQAVAAAAESIASSITVITDRLRRGGRLIYIGAGTSGRLGVLDASECPPTFSTPPGMVIGLIAGGDAALRTAAEGIEDHPEIAVADLQRIELSNQDVLVGIASSGRTPYVVGALQYARDIGAYAIGLACNDQSVIAGVADHMITLNVGPEIISGSTRMKAGTVTKMVLNMLTTGAMVQLGKTYGNLMVDLKATNAKLVARSQRLLSRITGVDQEQAIAALQNCDGQLKTAIVMILKDIEPADARQLLADNDQQLRRALQGNAGRPSS